MTAQEMILDLLRYIGVTGFAAVANSQALNRPGLDTDDTNRAIAAVNSGLQTIQKWGPQDLKQGRRSALYPAPVTVNVTIDVSNPRQAIGQVNIPASHLGCSIMIEGDKDLNRVDGINGMTYTLLRAYLGTTTTNIVRTTIYFDTALLDMDVQSVLEPVFGSGLIRLYPSANIDEFERLRNRAWLWYSRFGGSSGGYIGTLQSITTAIGIPARYLVGRARNGTPFLRVAPMPAAAFEATFAAKLRAEHITVAVLNLSGGADPNYIFTSLHQDEIEGVLLPIARWRFFTHPALKNAEIRASVREEYEEVMFMLKSGKTLESSVQRTRATYI